MNGVCVDVFADAEASKRNPKMESATQNQTSASLIVLAKYDRL